MREREGGRGGGGEGEGKRERRWEGERERETSSRNGAFIGVPRRAHQVGVPGRPPDFSCILRILFRLPPDCQALLRKRGEAVRVRSPPRDGQARLGTSRDGRARLG